MLDDVRFLHNKDIFSSKMEIAIPSKKPRGQPLKIFKEGLVGLTNCFLASTLCLQKCYGATDGFTNILILNLAV